MMARILAVDDAQVMRHLVKASLEAAGHEVITQEDGTKALAFAKTGRVDLVITDQNMPCIKGTTLIRRLREIDAYSLIPILMLSTESGDAVKKLARDSGADGWVQKPIDPDRLIHGVKTMLEKFDIH